MYSKDMVVTTDDLFKEKLCFTLKLTLTGFEKTHWRRVVVGNKTTLGLFCAQALSVFGFYKPEPFCITYGRSKIAYIDNEYYYDRYHVQPEEIKLCQINFPIVKGHIGIMYTKDWFIDVELEEIADVGGRGQTYPLILNAIGRSIVEPRLTPKILQEHISETNRTGKPVLVEKELGGKYIKIPWDYREEDLDALTNAIRFEAVNLHALYLEKYNKAYFNK